LFIFTSYGSVAYWNQAIYFKNFKLLQNSTDIDKEINLKVDVPETNITQRTPITIFVDRLGALTILLNNTVLFSGQVNSTNTIEINPEVYHSGVYNLVVNFSSLDGEIITKSEIIIIGDPQSRKVFNWHELSLNPGFFFLSLLFSFILFIIFNKKSLKRNY
jgi:hypothetical protein